MKFILIIWLTSILNQGTQAEKLGGLTTTTFKDQAKCEAALQAVKAKAVHVDGVCVGE